MGKNNVIQPIYTELSIDDPRSLHEWYRIYALCFPDPNEREEEAEFRNILNMNHNARLQKELGPWQEAIFAIRDRRMTATVPRGRTFRRLESSPSPN